MKIAIDAMGGDRAPGPNIKGAIKALEPDGLGNVVRKDNIEIVLVGKKKVIKKELSKLNAGALPIEIRDASQVIEMGDSPMRAVTKKLDSSLVVGVNLLHEGKVDGLVSAGNSGAFMAASAINLDKLRGVKRPAIASIFPTLKEPCVIVDAGANAECKPKHLYQFALMGEAYVRDVYKRRIPRIGLVSMGHEKGKGNKLTRSTYKMLMKSDVNFIGNIEGNDIITGDVDVVVCDGFTGNIILKFGESIAGSMVKMLKREIDKNLLRKIGAGIMKGAFSDLKKKVFYEEIGGAPLLGLEGTCIISHGNSNAKAIKNAVNVAAEFIEQDVNKHIEENL
ncbi:MAG: phosphate acyltransferase PlsX [Elusimicrobiota bacterium]